MKTTIDIADPLLRRAKQLAARRPEPLRTHTVGGRGLRRGLSWDDWNALRALAYEERGGGPSISTSPASPG